MTTSQHYMMQEKADVDEGKNIFIQFILVWDLHTFECAML